MKRAEPVRSFLEGRTMGEAVARDRELVVSELLQLGLNHAARATQQTQSFHDFYLMRGAMLAGGLHTVRRRGGRGIDR